MYAQPTSLDDALKLAGQAQARFVMGGTDFFPAHGEGVPDADIIDLSRVVGLRDLEIQRDTIRIGAGVTWTDVIKSNLPPAFDALKAAGQEVGSVQIQNAGTVVGNICNASPAADGVPPLLTLDAEVLLLGPRGVRNLPLSQFIQGPRQTQLAKGELVTGLRIPTPKPRMVSSFLKLGSRKYLVISIAMVAVCLRVTRDKIADLRVSVGACSPVARRLTRLEMRLTGQPVHILAEPGVVNAQDLASLSPIDDVRGSAIYRLDAVQALIQRALVDAAERSPT